MQQSQIQQNSTQNISEIFFFLTRILVKSYMCVRIKTNVRMKGGLPFWNLIEKHTHTQRTSKTDNGT